MQQLFKFTVLIFLMGLFSCETLVYKEYRLHARNYKEDQELNELLSEEGIYKEQMDSSQHKLSFMYSKRKNDLKKINDFFKKNDLINFDTTSEEIDSSYLFIDEQNAILDSLAKIDNIAKEKALAELKKKRAQERLDSAAAILKKQDSLKSARDTVISPVLDMINVF